MDQKFDQLLAKGNEAGNDLLNVAIHRLGRFCPLRLTRAANVFHK